jgi:hypothetical protein
MDWDLSRCHGPRCPDLSRRAGPFAAEFDSTDSVVARTGIEALAADQVLTEGDRLADDFADASAMMAPELLQLRRAANTGQRSASRAA